MATIDATSGQLVSCDDHQAWSPPTVRPALFAAVCLTTAALVNLIETSSAFSLTTLRSTARSTTNGDILIALIVARTNLHTSTLHFHSLTASGRWRRTHLSPDSNDGLSLNKKKSTRWRQAQVCSWQSVRALITYLGLPLSMKIMTIMMRGLLLLPILVLLVVEAKCSRDFVVAIKVKLKERRQWWNPLLMSYHLAAIQTSANCRRWSDRVALVCIFYWRSTKCWLISEPLRERTDTSHHQADTDRTNTITTIIVFHFDSTSCRMCIFLCIFVCSVVCAKRRQC